MVKTNEMIMNQIRAWLAARNMPFSVPPLCLWPERLRGKSWNRIPMEELACHPDVKAVEILVQVHAGQSATLSCQVHHVFYEQKRKLHTYQVDCWLKLHLCCD